MDYGDYINGLRLRHFESTELTDYANRSRNGKQNALPPPPLWSNIRATLWVLDLFREDIGKPIVLVSSYRSIGYNGALPGAAPTSQHTRNAAIDFQVRGMSPAEAFERLMKYRNASVFRGGLGLYSTFVHIDTRGSNATW